MRKSPDRERLLTTLDAWAAERCISEFVCHNTNMVATWVDLCAPSHAKDENKLLACKDLCVVFFALDDYDGNDVVEVFSSCEAALAFAEYGESSHPLVNAYSAIVREIERRSPYTSSYKDLRRALIHAYRERNRTRADRQVLDSTQHMFRRRTTIYTRQWIDLWEVLEGCTLSPEERESDLVGSILNEIVDWQIFENELVSVERDGRHGEQNLVSIIRRERCLTLQSAAAEVAAMHRESALRLETLLSTLRTLGGSPQLCRYTEILERCYRGAVAINDAHLPRYRRVT